jgi:hypothetical protein
MAPLNHSLQQTAAAILVPGSIKALSAAAAELCRSVFTCRAEVVVSS